MNVQNLNETQKAAVNVAQILTQVTGVNYEFFESSQDEQGKYVGENGSHNRNTNTIRIDINAGMKGSTEGNNIMIVTLAHELTHYIESLSPNQYAKLQEFAFEKLSETTGQDIHELIHIEENRIKRSRAKNELAPLNKRELAETAKSELVARSFEGMLTDAKAVKQLAQQDVGLFNKLKNKVMEFISKIEKACRELLDKDGKYKKGTVSKEARTLQKYAKEMRELWMDALKDAGENVKRVEAYGNEYVYSDRESFDKQVDKVVRGEWNGLNALFVSDTPELLLNIGLEQLPMLYTKKHLKNALKPRNNTNHRHGLTVDQIKLLPEIVKHPAFIMDSFTRNDSIIIVSDKFNNYGEPLILSVKINGEGMYELQSVKSNFITSVYGKGGIEQFIKNAVEKDAILYINNKKSQNLFSLAKVQFPHSLNKYDFDIIIRQSKHVVNTENRNKLFSMRQEVEETKDLIAVHNLSEKNLMESLKLGGFPMPSIAITKAKHGFNRFGSISVVFKKDTIDPSNGSNKVYSGDAWTPVFPGTEYKINDAELKKLADKFNMSPAYIEQFIEKPEDAVDRLKNQSEVKKAFLESKGAEIEKKTTMPPFRTTLMNNEKIRNVIKERNISIDEILRNEELQKELSEIYLPVKEDEPRLKKIKRNMFLSHLKEGNAKMLLEDDFEIMNGNASPIFDSAAFEKDTNEYLEKNNSEYTEYIERALDGIYEDKYLIKPDVDPFYSDGSRKGWNQIHLPYNLENIVKLMKQQEKGKGGNWFGGAKNLKGAATRELNSLKEIKQKQNKIQDMTGEEWEHFFEGMNDKIIEIDNEIVNDDNMDFFDRMETNGFINETMVTAFSLSDFNKQAVKRVFEREQFKINDKVYEMMKSLREELQSIPVQYFEAKPERAVGLNEIAYVVIPDSLSKDIKKAMNEHGISYKEYRTDDVEDRKKALNSEPDVLFRLRQNYKGDIDNWYNSTTKEQRLKDNGRFHIGTTSEVLKSINLKDMDFYFGKSKIQKILNKHKNMTIDIIKEVPDLLENPIIVMDSVTRKDSLVVLGELYTDKGMPVMAAILIDPKNKKGEVEDFGIISSAYTKENIGRYQNLLNNSIIRYINPDEKRTNNWLSKLRLQLPSQITNYGSISKISLEDGFVNISQNPDGVNLLSVGKGRRTP